MERTDCNVVVAGAIDWADALRRHERWLRGVILVRVGEPQAVDEVLQEVAVAAVAQQAPLADRSKLGPWLYQLARRQALMYCRRQGRQRRLTHRYAQRLRANGPATSEDPLAWLLADEQRQKIRQALRGLAARDAELLWLKYAEDWDYRQIAEHLAISTSAVEARLHRARERLRRELARLEAGESP